MKSNLPKVSALVVVSTIAIALPAHAQEAGPPSGQQLVERAARQFEKHPTLQANVRQRVTLFGQHLVGSGSYAQLKTPSGKRFRLDLTLQAGERLTSLQQLNDGKYLWIRRDSEDSPTINVVDLRRVEEAIDATESAAALHAWSILGGLDQLLAGLAGRFDFGPPTSGTIAGLPVWVVHGRWQRNEVARLLHTQEEAILAGATPNLEALPPHLPHRVTLVLGQGGRLPLFPYRIEFSRAAEGTTFKPIMAIELFEVRAGTQLDPRYFEFQSGDQRIEDATDAYIAKLNRDVK